MTECYAPLIMLLPSHANATFEYMLPLRRLWSLKPRQDGSKHGTHPPTSHLPQRHARFPNLLEILILLRPNPQFRKCPANHASCEQTNRNFVRAISYRSRNDTLMAQLQHIIDMRHRRISNLAVRPILQILLSKTRIVLVDRSSSNEMHIR